MQHFGRKILSEKVWVNRWFLLLQIFFKLDAALQENLSENRKVLYARNFKFGIFQRMIQQWERVALAAYLNQTSANLRIYVVL
jgi:hypothetical protein